MLRQVFIVKRNEVIYSRVFGNALINSEMEDLSFKIQAETKKKLAKLIGYYDYLKYRIAYLIDIESDLIFVFVTGLMDDFFRYVRPELVNFKNRFVKMFKLEIVKKQLDPSKFNNLDSIIDEMHQNIPTKIAVVGFAGVGKTTIKSLIKMDQLPLQHIPTISGDVATIQVGKLKFRLFDFAGQDEFKYLWKGFLRGSQAVLVVTDSTQSNLDKSMFFMDLIQSEVPHARSAIIGNKQDLRGALTIEKIENFFKLKTYPMVANRRENRNKMI
ncbi:MAG: ADP-ribosylation factor-like protein, partial [Promethearchaeota archaeon]